MNFTVYFIDDDSTTSPVGKWKILDAFVEHLATTYPGHTFERGAQDAAGQPHNDWLSTQADLIYELLQKPDSLVLLDVRMDSDDHRRAACALWSKANELGLGDVDWNKLDATKDVTTKLAGAVITLGRHFGTRIAWVTTQTERLALYTNLSALAPHIPWEVPLPANAWQDADTRSKLDSLITAHYLNRFLPLREQWAKIGIEAMIPKWKIAEHTKELFPTGFINGVNYHELNIQYGHYSQLPSANDDLIKTLLTATCFERHAKTDKERLAILKSATRGQQIPLFVVHRLLRKKFDYEDYEAIEWDGRWQAPELVWAFEILGDRVSTYKETPAFTLALIRNGREITFTLVLTGEALELELIQRELQMGAAKRSIKAGRNGNPGEMTLALDILEAQWSYADNGSDSSLTITRTFNIRNL